MAFFVTTPCYYSLSENYHAPELQSTLLYTNYFGLVPVAVNHLCGNVWPAMMSCLLLQQLAAFYVLNFITACTFYWLLISRRWWLDATGELLNCNFHIRALLQCSCELCWVRKWVNCCLNIILHSNHNTVFKLPDFQWSAPHLCCLNSFTYLFTLTCLPFRFRLVYRNTAQQPAYVTMS